MSKLLPGIAVYRAPITTGGLMDGWHSVFLGLRAPPRELSDFELLTFFTFSAVERSAIDERRQPAYRLGLALHIGFLRMSGRMLDAFRVVPPVLWRHLGKVLECDVPELASLRALYRRGRTLFDQQHAERIAVS